MLSRRTAFLLFLILCLCASVAAQQPRPQRDPQALAIAQQSHAAMGGVSAQNLTDTVIQATVTQGAEAQSPATLIIKTKGDRMRWESPAGDALVLRQGRAFRLLNGQWKPASDANTRNRRAEHLPALLLAHELGRDDVSATYVGTATVEGRSAHQVRLARVSSLGIEHDTKLTKDSELDVFIDAESFVILKVSYIHLSATDSRRGLPMEVYYGDYRRVGGLLVPFHQRVFFNGNPIYETRITSFAANVGLSDAEFEGR
jgi:hypothetical protein